MSSQDSGQFKGYDTIEVLIAACGDKEESVNSAVIKSLTKLASVYPNHVVKHFCDFYKNQVKVNPVQLGNVIKVLEQTCVNHMKAVRTELAAELVSAMLRAMMQNTDYQPTVQLDASAVLVAIGHVHLDLVLQSLIQQITAANVPHYTIPHTLGTLAAVNTQDIVPFIKDILAKMLPLLTLVKAEGTKQAFAYAFGHFAVAVSEHIGDNVASDNITTIKDNFVVEFSIIFDVLYNQWLHSHEARVSESVLEALGPITRLISERKFDETVNKFVLSLLSLYRKHTINSYHISQCISYLLTPSPLNPKLTLTDNVVNSTNHSLFSLVVLEPDYDQPHTVKNHFEVLRCFDHMAGQFPDQTIEGLLNQCKNNQEKDRMKAVIILTHLTTSSQVFVEKYAAKFITIMRVMTVMEHGVKMKKLLVRAIVGLVYRNCICSAEDFNLVEFIIKHCGYEPSNASSEDDANDLQDTCKSSLILLCNSATNVRTQLHDLLLKSLTLDEFTPSMSTVSLCLSALLQNNFEALGEDTETVPELKVSPDLIFIRCLTHLAEPENVARNKNILMFLDEYSGDIHNNLKKIWSVEVQRMLKFVVNGEPCEEWHTMLIDLLTAAIEQVNNDKWVENIANLLVQQILNTKQPPLIKGMSLQFLATLSCHMTNAATVEKVLKIILLALKSIPMESVDYVSKAIGIASSRHGEYILNELDAFYKEVEGKRGLKILNFMTRNSKNEAENNVSKYAAIVCYGKVAKECLDAHVLGRLGEHVTGILLEILKANPPFDLCRATVTSLYEISMAFQMSPHLTVSVRNRWQLLHAVLEQIFNPNLEKRNVELYPIIVKASKALTKLQSILPEARNTMLKVLFNNIFGELSSFKKKYEIEGNGDKNDLLAKTLNDSLTLLHDLIRELIIQSTCLSTIDDLVSLLLEWLTHNNDEIRTASVLIMQVILETFIKNVKLNYETPSKFGQMGYLLGLIVPGVADTNFPVRLTTVDCIKLIVQIQYLYEGHTLDPEDECMEQLTVLHSNVLTNDLNMVSQYCTELCDSISDKVPHEHTMQFLESLLESYDDEEFRSTGISAVLNALFVRKGQDLYQNIERIVEILIATMDRVGEQAKDRLLGSLLALTRHHANAVTAVLLAQKIPLKSSVITAWRHMARDDSLSAAILDNFLRLMNSTELFEDPYHITEHHIAALQPLTLISALGEMLSEPAMADICVSKFPELFSVLYTIVACYLDAEPPAYSVPANRTQERFGFIPNREAIRLSPARIAMGTFSAFLDRAECQKVREACALCLSKEHGDSTSTLLELVPILSGAISRGHCARHLSRLVPSLAALARAPLPPRRAAALALLHDLLNYRCNDNSVLIETVLATLSTGWKDEDDRVRACSLRGAANVARLRSPHREQALPAALAALSRGVDAQRSRSPTDNVPLAAMQGLSRLLTELDSLEKEYERELLSVAHKIRPFMNTECALLREHSIRLFGLIASRVNSESLVDQAIASLPCFLLHLSDSNPAVVRASKFTLKQVFKTLNAPKSNDLVQRHLVDEGRLLLDDFLTALLRCLAKEVPASVARCLQTAVNYLNGAREDLEPYPPLLIGKLYTELYNLRDSDPEHATVDDDVTRSARSRLHQLMKDPKPLVRQHAALALTYICLVEESGQD